MATVYLVHDLRHDRPVALKVLHPDRAATFGPQRFQQEIRVAARLQHPHVLSVLDSGELPGTAGRPAVLWFTMPFVDGETLRSRLAREKQLPVEEAVEIACEAADGLEYAHRQGVVHRDVKPENILLAAGHALVADFGIAMAARGRAGERASGRAEGETDGRLTDSGTTVGTPAYMSPEQAAGETMLDGRTDQYSLACVLWEMLAGEPPFSGPTVPVMLARRFTETPRPLRRVRSTVPEGVDRAVARALSRSPVDRFASAGEFGDALRDGLAQDRQPAAPLAWHRSRLPIMLALGIALALAAVFVWLGSRGRGEAADAAGPIPVRQGGTELGHGMAVHAVCSAGRRRRGNGPEPPYGPARAGRPSIDRSGSATMIANGPPGVPVSAVTAEPGHFPHATGTLSVSPQCHAFSATSSRSRRPSR